MANVISFRKPEGQPHLDVRAIIKSTALSPGEFGELFGIFDLRLEDIAERNYPTTPVERALFYLIRFDPKAAVSAAVAAKCEEQSWRDWEQYVDFF